jgi:hypothetical protein
LRCDVCISPHFKTGLADQQFATAQGEIVAAFASTDLLLDAGEPESK